MKKHPEYSREHLLYLRGLRRNSLFVHFARIAFLLAFLLLWELFLCLFLCVFHLNLQIR